MKIILYTGTFKQVQ